MNKEDRRKVVLELIENSVSMQREIEALYAQAVEMDNWDLATAYAAKLHEGTEFLFEASGRMAWAGMVEEEVQILGLEFDQEGNPYAVNMAVYEARDMINERCARQLLKIDQLMAEADNAS